MSIPKVDASGWSAALYNKNASFVYSDAFTSPVLELLNAQPGEKIIDFGCGSGELALRLKEAVGADGYVAAFDFSEDMITKAQSNGITDAFVSDAQALKFPSDYQGPRVNFDAVFSNATLHWCKRDPGGVLESAKSVLKPGGRFVVEMGGFLNCIGLRSTLHNVLRQKGYDADSLDPWYFPSPTEYEQLLLKHGFQPKSLSLIPRVTPLKDSGVRGWLEVFARSSFCKNIPEDEANAILDEVAQICARDCRDKNGEEWMVYMRLRIVAEVL